MCDDDQLSGIDEFYGTMSFGPSVETEDTLITATNDTNFPSQGDRFVEEVLTDIVRYQSLATGIQQTRTEVDEWDKQMRTVPDGPERLWTETYNALCEEIGEVAEDFEACKAAYLAVIASYVDSIALLIDERNVMTADERRATKRLAEEQVDSVESHYARSVWRVTELHERYVRLMQTDVHDVVPGDFAPSETATEVGRLVAQAWPGGSLAR